MQKFYYSCIWLVISEIMAVKIDFGMVIIDFDENNNF